MVMTELGQHWDQHSDYCCKGIPHLGFALFSLAQVRALCVAVGCRRMLVAPGFAFLHGMHSDISGMERD